MTLSNGTDSKTSAEPEAELKIDGRKALAKRLSAVLDNVRFRGGVPCDCAECRRARRSDWSCGRCGYDGPMPIEPCSCAEIHAQRIEHWRDQLACAQRERDRGRKRLRYDLEKIEGELALVTAFTIRRCRHGKAEPVLVGWQQEQCVHGRATCPVCTGIEDEHAQTIRDLREELDLWGLLAP